MSQIFFLVEIVYSISLDFSNTKPKLFKDATTLVINFISKQNYFFLSLKKNNLILYILLKCFVGQM